MCTTILLHIEGFSSNRLDAKRVKELAATHRLWATFAEEDIEPQRSILRKKSKASDGLYFALFLEADSGCSCGLVENIQNVATSEKPGTPRLFGFLRELVGDHRIANCAVLFSEDEPEQVFVAELSLAAFEERVMHQYGWLSEEEQEGWQYDMNTAFLIEAELNDEMMKHD